MSSNDAYTDVVELCSLLQCLGFSVKSLETCDENLSQDGAARTVVINCQSSGLNVVLESAGIACSCPATNKQNSGVWQVSGVTGGKQLDKEFGCTLLGSLPKSHRERLSAELQEMIRCIKQFSGVSDAEEKPKEINKSASMIEMTPPEKRLIQAKEDTPTRYRSLDTLTGTKANEQPLPAPGPLLRKISMAYADDDKQDVKTKMCRRQSTYTLSSTPGSMRKARNKTSSPIQSQHTILDSLIAAEKAAEDLKSKIALVIKEFADDAKNDSSISSLVLDVSKISLLKAETSKQFASSPNLSAMGVAKEEFAKSRLKRFESSSTSNLAPKVTPNKDGKSRLKRLSPNIFRFKKDSPGVKAGAKGTESKSKLNSIFKAKIATPVHGTRSPIGSPNLSASKRKFSHVKSTIPRPSKKE